MSLTPIPPLDPERADLLPAGTVLPAVGMEHLTADAVRARFAHPPAWHPEQAADTARLHNRPIRGAAVLVPLVQRGEGLHLILTRRHPDLPEHAGQISFPGGRRDSQDTHPVVTALREAREEIGLRPDGVEILGTLPLYLTASRYVVTPVVALVPMPEGLEPCPTEVSEVFEVPLEFLMDPAHHERRSWTPDQNHPGALGVRREFFSIPYERDSDRYFIWGATAAMIRNLYRLLIA